NGPRCTRVQSAIRPNHSTQLLQQPARFTSISDGKTLMRCLLLLAPLLAVVPARAVDELRPPAPAFDRTVAPLLASRCLDCHGAPSRRGGLDLSGRKSALAGGKSGAVIVPGKPDESLLWEYVRDGKMPPKTPLSAAEKKVLRGWIEAGAPWGTDPIDP